MWEVIGKGRELVPFEQDYFPERDFWFFSPKMHNRGV